MSAIKKLSDDQLAQAKNMYMNYVPVADIGRAFNVHRNSINYYVHGTAGWKKERDLMKNELVAELSENKAAQITRIYGTSLEVLIKCLEDLKNRNTPLTPVEGKNVAAIIDSLDKIVRLDQGSPTDIIADTKPATVIEIREALKADPFLNYEVDDEISPDSKSDS